MKKILLLLLISLHAFSQVFEVDSSFKFEVVKKREPSMSTVTQLGNDLMLVSNYGNVFNGEMTEFKSFLMNKDGLILSREPNFFFNYIKNKGTNIVTNNNKLIGFGSTDFFSFLQRYQSNGSVDSTFKFPFTQLNISSFHILPNQNILITSNVNNKISHLVFDKNGGFVKALQLSQLASINETSLFDLKINDFNELFLIITDVDGNIEIIKTNENFEIDNSFSTIRYTLNDANKREVYIFKNELYFVRTNKGFRTGSIDKYDRNGKLIQTYPFNDLNDYYQSLPNISFQNDGSFDLFFQGFQWNKILPNRQIISVPNEKRIYGLFTFDDGSSWTLKNNSGLIEKSDANGKIDPNFKLKFENEFQLYINKIQKIENGCYLLEYARLNRSVIGVGVYNKNDKLVHEFYDSKTIWQTASTGKSFVIRGDGKFYNIDSNLKITARVDNLEQILNSQTPNTIASFNLDLKNDFTYKVVRENDSRKTIISRFIASTGVLDSFSILTERAHTVKPLGDGRIAVMGDSDDPLLNQYIDIYNSKGERDLSVERIKILNRNGANGVSNEFYTVEYAKGFIIQSTYEGFSGNKHTFFKFNEVGKRDEKYKQNVVELAQFIKFGLDGSIYTNSALIDDPIMGKKFYNCIKFLPNGKIDSTFKVNVESMSDFELFDENTMYAISNIGFVKMVNNLPKKVPYFYLKPLPKEISWYYPQPLRVTYSTILKNVKVVVTGDGVLNGDIISITSDGAGLIKLEIFDENNKVLASQNIVLKKIKPTFSYNFPQYRDLSGTYNFSVKSSSGLPVIITVLGSDHENSVSLRPPSNLFYEIKMVSNGNNQYERIEQKFSVLSIEEPLANEPEESLIYYPNPVKETLFVQANKLKIDDFKLIAMDGREIPISFSRFVSRYEISLKNVPAGLYILQANTQTRRFTYRIVVD